MGASSSVRGHLSSPVLKKKSKDILPVGVLSTECPTSRLIAQSPEPDFAAANEEIASRVDSLGHQFSCQLHLLLYARSLFDDLVADGEAMDTQAFAFFIQEILHKCTLHGKRLRSGVCENLTSRLGTKIATDFKLRSIRWYDAESLLVSILNEVSSNTFLFEE